LEAATTPWNGALVRGEQLFVDALNDLPGGAEIGENTCNDAEKDYEDDARFEGWHIVKRKTVIAVGS